eukprot:gene49728-39231_t
MVDSGFIASGIFANWLCSVRAVRAVPHAVVGAIDDDAIPLIRAAGLHPLPMVPAVSAWARAATVNTSRWSLIQKMKPMLVLAAQSEGLG